MPTYVISQLAKALNEDGKPLHGSRILVLGLSYKANIDDTRSRHPSSSSSSFVTLAPMWTIAIPSFRKPPKHESTTF